MMEWSCSITDLNIFGTSCSILEAACVNNLLLWSLILPILMDDVLFRLILTLGLRTWEAWGQSLIFCGLAFSLCWTDPYTIQHWAHTFLSPNLTAADLPLDLLFVGLPISWLSEHPAELWVSCMPRQHLVIFFSCWCVPFLCFKMVILEEQPAFLSTFYSSEQSPVEYCPSVLCISGSLLLWRPEL